MKLCSDKETKCYPICDFCKHYDFGTRYCKEHQTNHEPDEGCNDFYCYKLDKE
jgi:hypothetical protein